MQARRDIVDANDSDGDVENDDGMPVDRTFPDRFAQRALLRGLGRLADFDTTVTPGAGGADPMVQLSTKLATPALTFPSGVETRRIDGDGRIKLRWSTSTITTSTITTSTVPVSALFDWVPGGLDVVIVEGWIVITQPDGIVDAVVRRHSPHARLAVDASGVERICLKPAHLDRLDVHASNRNVLVAPVPERRALIITTLRSCSQLRRDTSSTCSTTTTTTPAPTASNATLHIRPLDPTSP